MKHASFKCLKCNGVVIGDGIGSCISCDCGELYIDETKWYCRVGFQDADLVLNLDTNKTLAEEAKEQKNE